METWHVSKISAQRVLAGMCHNMALPTKIILSSFPKACAIGDLLSQHGQLCAGKFGSAVAVTLRSPKLLPSAEGG